MSNKDNKIKKTIRINPHIVEAVEGYRGYTKQDFTAAVETLLMKGLENHDSLVDITKKLNKKLSDLERQQRSSTDRISNLIIGLGRMIGRLYGHTRSTLKNTTGKSQDEIIDLENHGIKYVIDDLKWRNKEEDHV